MEFRDFAYWLQGYAEIAFNSCPSEDEWEIIKDHLNLCFNKVTPLRYGEPMIKEPGREYGTLGGVVNYVHHGSC